MLPRCYQAKDALTNSPASSCAGLPSSGTSNTTNSTVPSIHNIKPTSECKNLSSPFTSARGFTYNLECGIDLIEVTVYGGHDLMGVYVYTFTDCVNACAFFNDDTYTSGHGNGTCYAVSFNFALSQNEGNCWLKGHPNIPLHSNETVDSAVLLEH